MTDTTAADALAKAVEDVRAEIVAVRAKREAVTFQIEQLKREARLLTDDINALEASLPAPKYTGKVHKLSTGP